MSKSGYTVFYHFHHYEMYLIAAP